jgi:hypothetical protein
MPPSHSDRCSRTSHPLSNRGATRVRKPSAEGCHYSCRSHAAARSYSWRRPPIHASKGYEYASQLAEDAVTRSRDPRGHEQLEPLTVEQLAADDRLEPAKITRLIAPARRELFGDLSDAAIYKRRDRQHGRKPSRCNQSGAQSSEGIRSMSVQPAARSDERRLDPPTRVDVCHFRRVAAGRGASRHDR